MAAEHEQTRLGLEQRLSESQQALENLQAQVERERKYWKGQELQYIKRFNEISNERDNYQQRAEKLEDQLKQETKMLQRKLDSAHQERSVVNIAQRARQSRIVSSNEPVTNRSPSGLNSTEFTRPSGMAPIPELGDSRRVSTCEDVLNSAVITGSFYTYGTMSLLVTLLFNALIMKDIRHYANLFGLFSCISLESFPATFSLPKQKV